MVRRRALVILASAAGNTASLIARLVQTSQDRVPEVQTSQDRSGR